eukprot:scaffold2195_cov132-Cylindrotheca_fusiformis.AAC.21
MGNENGCFHPKSHPIKGVQHCIRVEAGGHMVRLAGGITECNDATTSTNWRQPDTQNCCLYGSATRSQL